MKIASNFVDASVSAIRAKMAELANKYPQYVGHFDAYVPVLVLSDVRTKMGLAFQKGEIALAAPISKSIFGDYYRTVYSLRNNVDTRILKGDMKEINAEVLA